MRVVRMLALRWASIASMAVLALALAGGTVRILPWLLAPTVPLRVTLPFAKALMSVAIETAFVLGVPIGFAIAAATLVRRGEARALFALGVSPLALARASVPVLVALGAVAVLAERVVDPRTDAPGRFATQLIAQGKTSCKDAHAARSVLVPMVGVSWLCFDDAPPRVVGRVPGGLRSAWFTARDLRPNDTLTEFTLWGARVAFPRTSMLPETRIAVERAVVRGLPAWGHTARLDTFVRSVVVALSVWIVAAGALWIALHFAVSSTIGALGVGGGGGLAVLWVLHAVDRAGATLLGYVWVPLAGLGAAALVALCIPLAAMFLHRVLGFGSAADR